MKQEQRGKGKLVPTGRMEPALDVRYVISHEDLETKVVSGQTVKWKKAVVQSLRCDDDQPIALGDFDLLLGDRIIRLKHIPTDPEWLVVSRWA